MLFRNCKALLHLEQFFSLYIYRMRIHHYKHHNHITNRVKVQPLMRHLQPDAWKLGNWMNLMFKGAMETGEFTFTKAGFICGISPVFVTINGIPFKSIVLLLISPPCGVNRYSSRVSFASVDFDPIHEKVDFSLWKKDTFVTFGVTKFVFKMLWIESLNSVWLLRLIKSNVMPAYNNNNNNKIWYQDEKGYFCLLHTIFTRS